MSYGTCVRTMDLCRPQNSALAIEMLGNFFGNLRGIEYTRQFASSSLARSERLTRSHKQRGVSPLIIAILLTVVIVAGTLLGLIFLTGLSSGFRTTGNTGLSSTITSHIYSTDASVDVQNRVANFSVVLANTVSTSQVGDVELTVGNRTVQNIPFALGAGQGSSIRISQRLNQTGTWTVKITSNRIKVNSYSFNVVPTTDEADYAITQWQSQNFYRNLLVICFLLSVVAFAVPMGSLARPPKVIRL